MASRRISSSGSCRCLRCRESYQQEMDSVRRELAVLIEDNTLSELRKKHSDLWHAIEVQNYEASENLESVKRREKATNDLQENIQGNEDDIQFESSRNQELQETITTLNRNISQLKASFPEDKKAALQRCQRSVEEKYQCQIDKIQSHHNSTKLAFNNMCELQAKVTYSRSEQERQLETEYMGRVEIMLEKATEDMLKDKVEWTCFKRSEMEKEQAEFKSSLREKIESELESSQKEMEMRVSEARLACLEEQRLTRQVKIEQILSDAKKQWQEEHERDIKQLTRKRQFDESDSFWKDE